MTSLYTSETTTKGRGEPGGNDVVASCTQLMCVYFWNHVVPWEISHVGEHTLCECMYILVYKVETGLKRLDWSEEEEECRVFIECVTRPCASALRALSLVRSVEQSTYF